MLLRWNRFFVSQLLNVRVVHSSLTHASCAIDSHPCVAVASFRWDWFYLLDDCTFAGHTACLSNWKFLVIFCLMFELINQILLNFSTIPGWEEQRLPHSSITHLAWIPREVSCIVLDLNCLVNFFANFPMLGKECAFVTGRLAVAACFTIGSLTNLTLLSGFCCCLKLLV